MNTEKQIYKKERSAYSSPLLEIFPTSATFSICWSADSASHESFDSENFEW